MFRKSVSQIVSGLSRLVTELEAAREHHHAEQGIINDKMNALRAEASAHAEEEAKATRIATNIKDLLK